MNLTMSIFIYRLLYLFLVVCLGTSASANAKHVALVIGNAQYQNEKPLRNPVSDAELIAEVLRKDLKFDEVILRKNLGRRELSRAISELADKARGADVVLVYYSGHGMQRGGQNYLLPVDAVIQQESDIDIEGIASARLLGELEAAGPKVAVVVLDACRDNPYGTRTKGTSKGLARMGDVGEGILVAYATRDGSTADDGNGRNSPYAMALARQLKRTDQPVRLAFELVADEVKASTNNKQKPITYGDLKSSVYLSPFGRAGSREAPMDDMAAIEAQGWQAAVQGNSVAAYEAYLEQYPANKNAVTARAAIARLKVNEARSADDAAWKAALAADSMKSYDGYIVAHPHGLYISTARIKLAALRELSQREQARQDSAVLPVTTPEVANGANADRPITVSTFRDCADCPEMVWLPPGDFTMGSAGSDPWDIDEKPSHAVKINYSLAVGTYAVTRAQFAQFVRESGHDAGKRCLDIMHVTAMETLSWENPAFIQNDKHPVVCVSWDDTQAYLKWLNGKTGKRYRLLSEAEWEYAARAGTTNTYYWRNFGRDDPCSIMNLLDATMVSASRELPSVSKNEKGYLKAVALDCKDGYAYTAPVGSFKANAFALYDMLGNVAQWTEDCWNESYVDAPLDGSARRNGDCEKRVVRGGSWHDMEAGMRTSYRSKYPTTHLDNGHGFRLARTEN
ncbi:MAG: SUMF1/EgtB/PvdO family nonheme iron enzyme [Pseudomonadota bacterium]